VVDVQKTYTEHVEGLESDEEGREDHLEIPLKVLWIENHSSIQSKLTIIKIYDEYVNVLRGMYSARFNGSAPSHVDSTQVQSAP
jgi:hypothetical protein